MALKRDLRYGCKYNQSILGSIYRNTTANRIPADSEKKISVVGATIPYDGVLLNIAMIASIKGAVLIEMNADGAKKIVSKMMMGMEVSEFDKVAQSAISEIGNMVCANVCTQFSEIEIAGLDISSPTLDGARRGYITCSQSYCYRL